MRTNEAQTHRFSLADDGLVLANAFAGKFLMSQFSKTKLFYGPVLDFF